MSCSEKAIGAALSGPADVVVTRCGPDLDGNRALIWLRHMGGYPVSRSSSRPFSSNIRSSASTTRVSTVSFRAVPKWMFNCCKACSLQGLPRGIGHLHTDPMVPIRWRFFTDAVGRFMGTIGIHDHFLSGQPPDQYVMTAYNSGQIYLETNFFWWWRPRLPYSWLTPGRCMVISDDTE